MADRLNLLTAGAKRYLVNLNEDDYQLDSQLIQTMPSPSGHVSRLAAKLLAQILAQESQNAPSEREAERLGQLAKEIDVAIVTPEKLRTAIRDISGDLGPEEARLRKAFPQTWLALDKAPHQIRKRGMVKLYIAECRSIRSIESLGRHTFRNLVNPSGEIQFQKDGMTMDRLIAQILYARWKPEHWWE